MKTSDQGNTWLAQSGGIDVGFYGVCFTDVNHGTAVGAQGAIYRTDDGGSSWAGQQIGGPGLQTVGFADADNGFATGYEARILHTANGGKTWEQQFQNGFYLWFADISVTDAYHATAVGQGGRILHTSDGGTNWILQSENPGYNLYGVDFIDAQNGFAVGDHGTILRTTNGGGNWTSQNIGDDNTNLFSVSFLDINNGLIVGNDFNSVLVLKTTDGGQNWTSVPNSIPETLYDVQFVSSQVAFAVGNEGVIYKSSDGGLNWVQQVDGKSTGLHSVSFINELVGTAVGENGTILHTTDGGASFVGIDTKQATTNATKLFQNYPNPFDASTTINWQLPADAHVTLKVFDFTGRELKTLVDCDQAKGEHKVKFDATTLPAGIYFYQLHANGTNETKTMIVLK